MCTAPELDLSLVVRSGGASRRKGKITSVELNPNQKWQKRDVRDSATPPAWIATSGPNTGRYRRPLAVYISAAFIISVKWLSCRRRLSEFANVTTQIFSKIVSIHQRGSRSDEKIQEFGPRRHFYIDTHQTSGFFRRFQTRERETNGNWSSAAIPLAVFWKWKMHETQQRLNSHWKPRFPFQRLTKRRDAY